MSEAQDLSKGSEFVNYIARTTGKHEFLAIDYFASTRRNTDSSISQSFTNILRTHIPILHQLLLDFTTTTYSMRWNIIPSNTSAQHHNANTAVIFVIKDALHTEDLYNHDM